MKIVSRICVLYFCLIPTLGAPASPVKLATSDAGNTYISGSDIRIDTPVLADLLAAGGRINMQGEVGADAALAGGAIDVRAPIRQDLRIAGGSLNIEESIGGELVAAGGMVRLNKTAAVAGSAWVAGSNVVLAGKVGKGAKIYANKLTLSGQIDGDTQLYAREIVFMPGAIINGNLTYSSLNPLPQDQAAQVQGTITRESMPEDRRMERESRAAQNFPWFSAFFILSMLAAGVLLYLFFPNAVNDAQGAIKQYPLRSLLIGLALLFSIPPIALFFMLTIIGIPIGLTLLALYIPMLLLGYVATAFFLGRRTADAMKQAPQLRLSRQALFLALALIILSLAGWIPLLGPLIFLLALVIGIGGWAVSIHMRFYAETTSPA